MPETASEQPPLLAVDVGNTSTKVSLRAGGSWRLVSRVPTHPVDELLDRLLSAGGPEVAPRPERCLVCCVVPAAAAALRRAWAEPGVPEPEVLGEQIAIPLPSVVPAPEKVGNDRLLVALGARETAGAPCVAVSAGTAITVDLVDPAGRFAGGAIAPGLRTSALALHGQTALLPLVEPAAPAEEPARSTEEALLSGIYRSAAGGILLLLRRYRQRPGCGSAPLVCTGSDAPLLLPALREEAEVTHEPNLLPMGMVLAAEAQE